MAPRSVRTSFEGAGFASTGLLQQPEEPVAGFAVACEELLPKAPGNARASAGR